MMRNGSSSRRLTTSLAGALLLLAAAAGAASAAPAPAVAPEQILAPPLPDTGERRVSWREFFVPLVGFDPLLGADATVRHYSSTEPEDGPPRVKHGWFSVVGSDISGGQGADVAGLSWDGGVEAIDGGVWAISHPQDGRRGLRWSEIDDQDVWTTVPVTRKARLTSAIAVPAPGGGRLIGNVGTTDEPRRMKTVLVDRSGRIEVTVPHFFASDASPLRDGGFWIGGERLLNGYDTESAVAVVSPDGEVRVRPVPGDEWLIDGSVATTAGIIGLQKTLASPDTVAVRYSSTSGRLLARRRQSEMGIPTAGCRQRGEASEIWDVAVGPAGLPIVAVWCGAGGVLLAELGPDLRYRRTVAVPGDASGRPYVAVGPTLPDGRLSVFTNDAQIGAIAFPDAFPVDVGRVRSIRRVGSRESVVRISCRRPYGSVCSGTVTLLAGDQPVAAARYALPGRPGEGESVIDRHVPSATDLPSELTARLAP